MVQTRAFDYGEPNPKPGVKRKNTSVIDDETLPLKKLRGNNVVSFYPQNGSNEIDMQFSESSSSK